jgi:hypothetical protein
MLTMLLSTEQCFLLPHSNGTFFLIPRSGLFHVPAVRGPRARVREVIKACRTPGKGGLTYRPGLDRAPAQPLRHGHSQAREGERVDPGPLWRRAEPRSRKCGLRRGFARTCSPE